MHKTSETARLRTAAPVCKPARFYRGCLGVTALLLTSTLLGCGTAPRARTITVSQLEAAPRVPQMQTARALATNPDALRALCTPLGARLGLLQIHSHAEWDSLRKVVPHLGSCPDLHLGMLVGLACWAGTPISAHWPIRIEDVRVCDGAGIVTGEFSGGTYLPDGAAFIELAQVPGLATVLVVDVDGTRFYPDSGD